MFMIGQTLPVRPISPECARTVAGLRNPRLMSPVDDPLCVAACLFVRLSEAK